MVATVTLSALPRLDNMFLPAPFLNQNLSAQENIILESLLAPPPNVHKGNNKQELFVEQLQMVAQLSS